MDGNAIFVEIATSKYCVVFPSGKNFEWMENRTNEMGFHDKSSNRL